MDNEQALFFADSLPPEETIKYDTMMRSLPKSIPFQHHHGLTPPHTPATDAGAYFFGDPVATPPPLPPLSALYADFSPPTPLAPPSASASASAFEHFPVKHHKGAEKRKAPAEADEEGGLAFGDLLGTCWAREAAPYAEPAANRRMHLTPLSPPAPLAVELSNRALWCRFHEHTTEMVLTRKGRCLFPAPKFTLLHLEPRAYYSVVLEIVPVDQNRYKFMPHLQKWISLGPIENPSKSQMYTHPSSPQLGDDWMKNDMVSFEHMKVTNYPQSPSRESCLLRASQKYRLRLFVVRHNALTMAPEQVDQEEFPETEFVAVTVYQNCAIRTLKKQYNPRAYK